MNRTHPWYASEWWKYTAHCSASIHSSFSRPSSSELSAFSSLPHTSCRSLIFFKKKKPWIWVKCTEAPVRRATALSNCWFPLIHLFVVVYACLLQSHDCVSIATRVWVIICVTTFIPLRKGEGEVRLSSLSKEGAKGRRKDRQKGSGREAQARKIGKKQRLCRDMFCLVLAFCVLSFTLHASLYQ